MPRDDEVVASVGLLRTPFGGLRRRSELRDDLIGEVIPFRITDPPKDAPLFFRRTIRGGSCVAVATGRPPRRSNAEKEQVDRVDLYCELVYCGCLGFSQHKQRASRTCPALPDRVDLYCELVYTISHYRSTQRCAAIFPVGGMKHSQDDPRRSLRSRSYGTTSSEK